MLLASGGNHNCVQNINGLICWGNDFDGQTNVPPDFKQGGLLHLAAGKDHSCGSNASSTLCWGKDEDGQSFIVPDELKQGQGDLDILAAGQQHNCGSQASKIYCWGQNSAGQSNVPADFNQLRPIHLAAGLLHTCGVNASNTRCWGDNRNGQIIVPAEFKQGGLKLLAGGFLHTCGSNDSTALCWGIKDSQTIVPPEFKNGNLDFLVSGVKHNCASKSSYFNCWGYVDEHKNDFPYKISKGLKILAAGNNHTCGLKASTTLCWGVMDQVPDSAKSFTDFPNTNNELTEKLSASTNDRICQKFTDQNQIICYKISDRGQTKEQVLYEDLIEFCLYQQPNNPQTAVLAQVKRNTPNVIYMQPLNQEKSLGHKIVVQNDIELIHIKSLQCGSQHVCQLIQDNQANCSDGSDYKEGKLTPEMKQDVIDIQAGKLRTCVLLKNRKVFCIGSPIKAINWELWT